MVCDLFTDNKIFVFNEESFTAVKDQVDERDK